MKALGIRLLQPCSRGRRSIWFLHLSSEIDDLLGKVWAVLFKFGEAVSRGFVEGPHEFLAHEQMIRKECQTHDVLRPESESGLSMEDTAS